MPAASCALVAAGRQALGHTLVTTLRRLGACCGASREKLLPEIMKQLITALAKPQGAQGRDCGGVHFRAVQLPVEGGKRLFGLSVMQLTEWAALMINCQGGARRSSHSRALRPLAARQAAPQRRLPLPWSCVSIKPIDIAQPLHLSSYSPALRPALCLASTQHAACHDAAAAASSGSTAPSFCRRHSITPMPTLVARLSERTNCSDIGILTIESAASCASSGSPVVSAPYLQGAGGQVERRHQGGSCQRARGQIQ